MENEAAEKRSHLDMLHDPKHPVWRLATVIVVISAISLVLWMNASHFDETEIRAILEIGAIYIGVEAVRHKAGA